jgi:hypothetical protein
MTSISEFPEKEKKRRKQGFAVFGLGGFLLFS